MNKNQVIDLLIEKLQTELSAMIQAAQSAHDAATHEESRAEDHHDTRGLEASYLAGAQAQRAGELQMLIAAYRQLPRDSWPAGSVVGPGALTTIRLIQGSAKGKASHYLIVGRGGGTAVTVEGVSVQVVTPQSPLGEALVGRKAGDLIEVEAKDAVREYRVESVE